MAEIIYQFTGNQVEINRSNIRWLLRNECDLFNRHLSLCFQKALEQSVWDKIYDEGTIYCMLFENGIPAARACVEKYSNEAWEIADVRVIKSYRNKGLACEISRYVLKYILDNHKKATIRTESDNYPMQQVISKLGFTPLT